MMAYIREAKFNLNNAQIIHVRTLSMKNNGAITLPQRSIGCTKWVDSHPVGILLSRIHTGNLRWIHCNKNMIHMWQHTSQRD